MSMRDVAKESNVSPSHLCNMTSGHRNPTKKTLEKLWNSGVFRKIVKKEDMINLKWL